MVGPNVKEYRNFGGETYKYHGFSVTKTNAKERAAILRNGGYNVRVVEKRKPRCYINKRRRK